MTYNEVFMTDIYHDLGVNYDPISDETLKNLIDVYIKVYYPKIKVEEVKNIIELLHGNVKNEQIKIDQVYQTVLNDMILDMEITNYAEKTKLEKDNFGTMFKQNYSTQAVIHTFIVPNSEINSKLDMYRIFNNFVTDDTYPFVQYQKLDGELIYKYNEDKIINNKTDLDVLSKWFENVPYGISFKIKYNTDKEGADRYLSMTVKDTGRLEYKTQLKEEDKATIDDITKTYVIAKKLIEKINTENKKFQLLVPNDNAFKFACLFGYLNVAKWLIEIKPDIDISSENNYAFRTACYNGNLNLAKWLLEIKPNIDISIENYYIFRSACNNGVVKVPKWLLEKKQKFLIIMYV